MMKNLLKLTTCFFLFLTAISFAQSSYEFNSLPTSLEMGATEVLDLDYDLGAFPTTALANVRIRLQRVDGSNSTVAGADISNYHLNQLLAYIDADLANYPSGTYPHNYNVVANDGATWIPSAELPAGEKYRIRAMYQIDGGNFFGAWHDIELVAAGSDTKPPVITLTGDAVVSLNLNDPYNELGATATDDTDGDITGSIVIGGDTVDTTQSGVYIVTYNVSDAAGNVADEVTREVRVGIITNITVTQEPTTISNQGDLDQPLIFTISNIPVGNDVSINSRSYSSDVSTVNGGGQLGTFTNALFNLTYDNSAVYPLIEENGAVKAETSEAINDQFNRTFTLKRHALVSAPSTSGVILAIRFVSAVSSGYVFDPSLVAGTGGTADNKSFILATGLEYYSLSAKNFNISKFVYPNPVSNELNISKDVNTDTYKVVNLMGRTVKEVTATGRLDVSDLSAGIYVLVTDAGIAKFVKK